jgi:uncharacterized protein YdaU (DUF1376 family)
LNYYPFHLGDYAAHTGHLEAMEDLAYRRLLDLYYLREEALPADVQATAKLVRMRSHAADVESVLNEFFTLTDAGWTHERCDEEIAKMQDKQAKARKSAAASVNARRANAERSLHEHQTDVERSLHQTQADVELPTPTPTPTPKEKEKEPKGSSSAARLPTCPTADLIDLYHEVLPEMPKVKLHTKDRVRALKRVWDWTLNSKRPDGSKRSESREESLEWFRSYFDRARENDFLMGRGHRSGDHANWKCDLDFLLTDKGMKHVIEKTQAGGAA